jgi:hypothetical protein
VVLSLVSLGQSSSSAQEERLPEENRRLVQRLEDVEDVLRKLQKIFTHITIAKDDAGRLEIILSGVNLRIVNGLGSTDCIDEQGSPIPDCPNGLGNLIVGYNEPRVPEVGENIRTGAHNVVVGQEHNFSRFGGLVVGFLNTISGDFAVVSGGGFNMASGGRSVVRGGQETTASGFGSSVSGGRNRTAEEDFDWVAGSLFEDE